MIDAETLRPKLQRLIDETLGAFPDPGEAMVVLVTAAFHISRELPNAPSLEAVWVLVHATAPTDH